MQSLDRVMRIIDVMISTEPNKYYSLTEISEASDLPLSSLHRILKAMEKQGLIRHDVERKLYTIGTRWLEYGLKIYDTMDYVSVLRPELEQLMRTVDASVYLSRPVDGESMIIERIDCITQTIRTYDRLGKRVPIYQGVANLTMLAHMGEKQKEQALSFAEIDHSELAKELERIKQQGYGIGEDDWSKGIKTIAAPVISHYQEVVGVISIKLMTETSATKKTLAKMIKEVLDTSNRVSWKMGAHY